MVCRCRPAIGLLQPGPGVGEGDFRVIHVIYDSCYLINGGVWPPVEVEDAFPDGMSHAVRELVPNRVQTEVDRLVEMPGKEVVGRKAQERLSLLLEELGGEACDIDPFLDYQPLRRKRGPDSSVDRAICGLACALAAGHPDDFIFIATRDNGVVTEAEALVRRRGLPVYTPTSMKAFVERLKSGQAEPE